MYCATDSGRTDYLIPTSHEGWREFILIDADNSDYDYTFSGITNNMHTFANYRYNPDLKTINRMTITPTGNTSGVKMDDIRAYTAVDAPAKNPSVTVGKNTITFEAEIHSGEYIEFYPETGKAYLNYYTSTYTDYQKMYRYYRDLNCQPNDPGTTNISNKVKYVKYIPQ